MENSLQAAQALSTLFISSMVKLRQIPQNRGKEKDPSPEGPH